MRRLDELLTAATTRGARKGPEDLIQHLERRLAGEREQVVASPIGRVEDRGGVARTSRTRWAFALASFAVAVAAVAIAVVTLGEDDVTDRDPVDFVQEFAANVRDGDVAAILASLPRPEDADLPFLEWMIGLDPKPQFTDCEVTRQSLNGSDVLCSVTYSPDSFFIKTLGEQSSSFAARVLPDGALILQGWPPPAGLSGVGFEMREWIATTYPELEEKMFGTEGHAGFVFSRQAGELLNDHVDEFLTNRDG